MLSFSFVQEQRPTGWRDASDTPDLFRGQPWAERVQTFPGAQVYTDRGGFFLAVPWRQGGAFPLAELFCFAQVAEMGEGTGAIFCFDRDGNPCFPNNGRQGEGY